MTYKKCKNKIIIISELTTSHIDYLMLLIKLLSDYDVKVLTHLSHYETLMKYNPEINKNIEFLVKKKHGRKIFNLISALRYIKKIRKYKADYFFINTLTANAIESFLITKFLPKKTKLISTVFNSSLYLSKQKVPFNIKSIKVQISSFFSRQVFNMSDMYITQTEYIKQNLIKDGVNKKIHIIPFLVYQNEITLRKKNQGLRIFAAGAFDSNRRDYSVLLQLLEDDEMRNNGIEIVLLCGNVNEKYKEFVSKLESFPNIKIYKEYLHHEDFDMSSVDVILAPLAKSGVHSNGGLRNYGETKSTYSFFLSIKYAIPVIFPSFYEGDKGTDKGIMRYGNYEELKQILINLTDDKNYDELFTRTLEFSKSMHIDNFREKLKNEL